MSKSKKDIQATVTKEYPQFVDECNTLDVDALNNRILNLAKEKENVENAKEADEGLAKAQEEAREFGAPYRESKKELNLKTKYLISLIHERGGQ